MGHYRTDLVMTESNIIYTMVFATKKWQMKKPSEAKLGKYEGDKKH